MGSERLPILSRSAEPTALQSQAGTISRSELCASSWEDYPTDACVGHSPMKVLALAFVLVGFGITAAMAEDSCWAQAAANELRAEELKNFMANCKDLMVIACEGRAIDQKIPDQDKDSFIKQCVKDAVGR